MESAFASKYGDTQDGQEIAHRATQAAVKFDLLRKTASVAVRKKLALFWLASISFRLVVVKWIGACFLQVKLSAGEQQEGSQSRLDEGGVSVMYNAARISAILEKFQEKVKQGDDEEWYYPCSSGYTLSQLEPMSQWNLLWTFAGIYPALPDVSEIDFTTLREEVSPLCYGSAILAVQAVVRVEKKRFL